MSSPAGVDDTCSMTMGGLAGLSVQAFSELGSSWKADTFSQHGALFAADQSGTFRGLDLKVPARRASTSFLFF